MAQNFKIAPTIPLQMGWIPYLNLLPLRKELERSSPYEMDWHKGSPAQVNKWLTEGKISLAPCSSVCLLKNSQLDIAIPLGVASSGPILSVYLGIRHEDLGVLEILRTRQHQLREIVKVGQSRYENDVRKLADFIFKAADSLPPLAIELAPPVLLTPASATSAALVKVLYRLWFGIDAYEMRMVQGAGQIGAVSPGRRPMELLIGDEALTKRPLFRAVLDLGEAWKDLTDLPFIYAVWQMSKKTMSPYWKQKLLDAAEIAEARMHIEPSYYLPDMPFLDCQGHPVDLGAYWKVIQYRVSQQHFKGLALFLSLVRNLAPSAVDHQAVINITRWEAFGAGANV